MNPVCSTPLAIKTTNQFRLCNAIRYGFITLLLLIINQHLFAAGPFNPVTNFSLAPSSNDQSMYYLSQIFGKVGNLLPDTGARPWLGIMFMQFGYAVAILGVITFGYTYAKGILDTAAQGEFLGKNSSIWVPLRSVAGIALVIPKASTGYSILQVFIMWVVVQGVGAADNIWSSVADYAAGGTANAVTQNISMAAAYTPTVEQNLHSLMQVNACLIAARDTYNANIANARQQQASGVFSSGSIANLLPYAGNDVTSPNVLKFETSSGSMINIIYETPSGQKFNCGSYSKTDTTASDKDIQEKSLRPFLRRLIPLTQDYANDFVITQDANTSAQNIYNLQGSSVDSPSKIAVTEIVEPFINNQVNNQGPSIQGNTTQQSGRWATAKKDGWIYAGAYLRDLSVAKPGKSQFSSANKPTMAGIQVMGPNLNTTTFSIPNLTNALPAQQQNLINQIYNTSPSNNISKELKDMIKGTPTFAGKLDQLSKPGATSASKPWTARGGRGVGGQAAFMTYAGVVSAIAIGGVAASAVAAPVLLAVVIPIAVVLAAFTVTLSFSLTANAKVSAFFMLPIFGHIILTAVAASWITYFVILFATALATNWTNCLLPFGATTSTMVEVVLIPFLGMLGLLLAFGITLAVYLPLVPFIYFSTASLGWFVGVLESMIAAPIIAIGLMQPDGKHEFWGKAEPAVMIIINIFLRPSLMLFGLVAGMILSKIGVKLVAAGFYNVVLNANSVVGIVNPIVYISYVGVFILLVVSIIQKCFGLIGDLPRSTIRFIEGGQAEPLGSDFAGDINKEAKQASDSMGQALSSAGKETRDAAAGSARNLSERSKRAKKSNVKLGEDKNDGGGGDDKGGGSDDGGLNDSSGATKPTGNSGGGNSGSGNSAQSKIQNDALKNQNNSSQNLVDDRNK